MSILEWIVHLSRPALSKMFFQTPCQFSWNSFVIICKRSILITFEIWLAHVPSSFSLYKSAKVHNVYHWSYRPSLLLLSTFSPLISRQIVDSVGFSPRVFPIPSRDIRSLTGHPGCLPFTKHFRKIRSENKWNKRLFWSVPAKIFRKQRNIRKGSPVFPDGMFQTKIRVLFLQSHLW